MKAIPLDENYKPCDVENVKYLEIRIPRGEWETEILPVITKGSRSGHGGPVWTWNGDTEKPTLKPSVLARSNRGDKPYRCHTWINDGKAIFLNDCTHDRRGQTLDLIDVEKSSLGIQIEDLDQ